MEYLRSTKHHENSKTRQELLNEYKKYLAALAKLQAILPSANPSRGVITITN